MELREWIRQHDQVDELSHAQAIALESEIGRKLQSIRVPIGFGFGRLLRLYDRVRIREKETRR